LLHAARRVPALNPRASPAIVWFVVAEGARHGVANNAAITISGAIAPYVSFEVRLDYFKRLRREPFHRKSLKQGSMIPSDFISTAVDPSINLNSISGT